MTPRRIRLANKSLPTYPECGSIDLAYERKGLVTARLNSSGDTWIVTFGAEDGSGWVKCDSCDWQSADADSDQHPVVAEASSVNFEFSLEVIR